jgi:hypothetical protein
MKGSCDDGVTPVNSSGALEVWVWMGSEKEPNVGIYIFLSVSDIQGI